MVFCADLLQNPDRPLFQLFVSGDFAVCENHRDDQIDTEVIQHHIAEPFHTASRRLPETVMSRPVFRSGGRKDLPDVALRFAIDQTGEKKLAGNRLAEPIIASLQKDGYEVIYAHDGFDALAKYRRLHPDIILLDIRMPGLDGYEVAKEIRKEDPGVPILFLTVLSDPKDAIKGLSVGADDYIRKSVAVEELKARLISKLRNQRPKLKRILDITPRTTLNTISHEITIDGAVHKLTQKEYELIYHFCHHMNVIHERPALEDLLWPGNTNGNNYLNKCISSVRGILRRDDAIQIITYNRAGVMFCIKDSEETEEKQEGCLQE